MQTMIAYHYSDNKFNNFDKSKSDGFWFTDIDPSNEEMLSEIGASGSSYCAKCEITFNDDTAIINGDNSNIFDQIDSEEDCDAIINLYDGFKDYAIRKKEQIKILEWISL